ncbi:MAG: GNAT family N-acetyltransferase [Desulfobacterales bacterium]|nr:MAG: GNAT family N-acetyltransferase [Desulfobacterales bacterium]
MPQSPRSNAPPMGVKNYPEQYEIHTTTKTGLNILIRPIRAEDAPRLSVLFHALSPRSIYFRFLMPIKAPSEEMLAKFTQIDHDRHVVLAATQKSAADEKILGVFRLMCNPEGNDGELAIVVGDPWQGKGVGAKLFEHGLSIAKERGIESLFGMVLAENTQVLSLARRLGFAIKWDPDARAYNIRLDLQSMSPQNM